MSRHKINQTTVERCLLTEIAPYETPTRFSNWGSYNWCRLLSKETHPSFLAALFRFDRCAVPFNYRIKKDDASHRTLSLAHPNSSSDIVAFYRQHQHAIIRACRRSPVSLRSPHHVAKFYTIGKVRDGIEAAVEDITEETAYAQSYFAYSRVSHLHKFFNLDDFTELEKRYDCMFYVDITKFFPSLYTHSISWAVRGKTRTKQQMYSKPRELPDDAFDMQFDTLLQRLNYNETHGIIVGPELCRIFAEIILQRIDGTLISTMEADGQHLGSDYWYHRYIDDYYLFFNDERTQERFMHRLHEELETYKLYLGKDKCSRTSRPFITVLSIRKLEISAFISDLSKRRDELRADRSFMEINRIRALMKQEEPPFSTVSGFLLSSLQTHISSLFRTPPKSLFDVLYVYLDLALHTFRMDVRVPPCFRISEIILSVLVGMTKLKLSEQAKIFDKMVHELRGAIETAVLQRSSVECMNLVILCSEFREKYLLAPDFLERAANKLREQRSDEYSSAPRLSYFEIVSLLYYIRDDKSYATLRDILLKDAEVAITELAPFKYAEMAYLLLDLVACPLLTRPEKDRLIHAGMLHSLPAPTADRIDEFRGYVSKRTWYFNWNQQSNLTSHLQKKRLSIAY